MINPMCLGFWAFLTLKNAFFAEFPTSASAVDISRLAMAWYPARRAGASCCSQLTIGSGRSRDSGCKTWVNLQGCNFLRCLGVSWQIDNTRRIHGAGIYGDMDPINIPQMLAYIAYMDPIGIGNSMSFLKNNMSYDSVWWTLILRLKCFCRAFFQ